MTEFQKNIPKNDAVEDILKVESEFGQLEKLRWVVSEAIQLKHNELCYFNLVIDEQLHKAKHQLMQQMFNIQPIDNHFHALWLLIEKVPSVTATLQKRDLMLIPVSYGSSLMNSWKAIIAEAIPLLEEDCQPIVQKNVNNESFDFSRSDLTELLPALRLLTGNDDSNDMTKILLPLDWVLCMDLQLDLSHENAIFQSSIGSNPSFNVDKKSKLLKKMAAREYRSFVTVDGGKLTTVSEGRVFYSEKILSNQLEDSQVGGSSKAKEYINNDSVKLNSAIKLRRGQSAPITTTVAPRNIRRMKSVGCSEMPIYSKGYRIRHIRKHRQIETNTPTPSSSNPTNTNNIISSTMQNQNKPTNSVNGSIRAHNRFSKGFGITIFELLGIKKSHQSSRSFGTYGSDMNCCLVSFRIHLFCGILNLISAFAIYLYCNYCRSTGNI